jgi:hypothetical protein
MRGRTARDLVDALGLSSWIVKQNPMLRIAPSVQRVADLPPFGRQLGGVRQFAPCATTVGEKSVKAKTRTKAGRP